MSSGELTTNIGLNTKDSITNDLYFLAHDREPIDNHKSYSQNEIKQELYENRFFLKWRVWRNMRKIRRHPQILYRFSESELKVLKPRRVG